MNQVPDVSRAARLLRSGQLVAFPTETVYGVGADALNAEAVARIYESKGRPPTSPLIVHVSGVDMARSIVSDWPAAADALAARYWPGPLTLVLPKRAHVPDIVTAGLPTVAVRMPDHPLAIELIRRAGIPLAAPSANRFSELSPTQAAHVRLPHVAMVLDGGPCAVGIESTVLSLAGERPVLLRPGMVSRAAIEALIGPVDLHAGETGPGADPSPGLHRRHYAPRTRLILGTPPAQGLGVHLRLSECAPGAIPHSQPMPRDPAAYAALLYDTLHRLDREGLDWIAVEPPPDTPEWAAILDRLRRAAAPECRR